MARAIDLTEGSIPKKMLAFAWPVFFGHLFQTLYNIVDSLVVGNINGPEALAAVASSTSMIMLLVGFVNGMFIGSGVVVARYVGAKDGDGISRAVHTVAAVAITAGLALAVIGTTLTPLILRLMNIPEDVMPNSVAYLRIYFIGIPCMILYNAANGIHNAVGDSRRSLMHLVVSSSLNVCLDLLFVAVFGLGVAGAAWATAIAQGFSAFLGWSHLMKIDKPWRVYPRRIRFDLPMLKQIVRIGLPSGLQNCMISLSNTVVQSNINSFGSSVMAGIGAFQKIEGFGFLATQSCSATVSTFISQNSGARRYDRVKKGARYAIVFSLCVTQLIGLIIYIACPYLIALFNGDPAVVAVGTLHARTLTPFFFLLALSHIMSGIMQGSGKPMYSMATLISCWVVCRILYMRTMVPLFHQVQTISWAYPVTWALAAVPFLFFFFKKVWLPESER